MKKAIVTIVAIGAIAAAALLLPRLAHASTLDIARMIATAAEKHGVDPDVMYTVIFCESGLNPNAVGDGGTSFGLAQIHSPAHPDITILQALDPEFSIEFMAKEMAAGRSWKWTCWTKHYGASNDAGRDEKDKATGQIEVLNNRRDEHGYLDVYIFHTSLA